MTKYRPSFHHNLIDLMVSYDVVDYKVIIPIYSPKTQIVVLETTEDYKQRYL